MRIRSEPLAEPSLRRAALELYGRVWPNLPDAIAQARRWGTEWFEVSTASHLCEGDRMLAHAGQVWCDLVVDGARQRVAALHAILVDPDHRGRGLARAVIEAALARLDAAGADRVILWSEKIDFYRRFGFRPERESAFRCPAPEPAAIESRALDLDDSDDLAILQRLLRERTCVSDGFAAADDGWHFLIDCAIARPATESLRYLPERDAVVIASSPTPATLRVADVIAPELPDLSQIAGAYGDRRFQHVELLLSPDRLASRAEPFEHPDEDVLQVRGSALRAVEKMPFGFSPFTRT